MTTFGRTHLTLAAARAAIQAMLDGAAKGARPVAMAVVDENGGLIAYACMDGTRPTPRQIAVRKAYTAARAGADSHAFAERLRGQGMSVGDLGDPGMVGVRGGVVIVKDGVVLGGIGVSGLAAEEDEALCRVGLNAMKL
jgi:uncharacterized protein GlcG (DUF336 family)